MSFTHLHNHSEYSLLDGAIKVDDLVERVTELGQSAVAITDHGWIAGAITLTKAAKEKGIKPIIGMETYVATGESHESPAKSTGDNYHLTLLAVSRGGYHNLMRLSSLAFLRGLSYKPRIDKNLLKEHAEGLILLSGCIGAELPQLIIYGDDAASTGFEKAIKLAEWYQSIFGDRFFIELMSHGSTGGIDHVRVEESGIILMDEGQLNSALVDIAAACSVGVVATNDAHYLSRQDGDSHDTLLCLGMGAWKTKEDRLRFPGAEHRAWEFYIKSDSEMRAASQQPYWIQACDNTQVVADMVEDGVIELGKQMMPAYTPPNDPDFEAWRNSQ